MNGARPTYGDELVSTAGVRAPRTRLLAAGRPLAQAVLRRRYELELHGAERVPAAGGVVLAANHVGWLDGPLLAICSPRPVHALTKREMFRRGLGGVLTAVGQIPLDRFHVDVSAIRVAVKALQEGLAVGVFPEGTRGAGDMVATRAGAAYLALVTGAPVVPVSFLGTRLPGSDELLPARGSRIAMTFGHPVQLQRQPWPRAQHEVAEAGLVVTKAILATIGEAQLTTGMTLPGPLGPQREKKRT